MDKRFEKWKQFVKKNEVRMKAADENLAETDYYIGDKKVSLYSGKVGFNAGMWLQSEDSQIRIYVKNKIEERIIWRSFQGENKEGPLHQHNFVEIGYVVDGVARQHFSDKQYQFREGDFWIVDRHCCHNDIYNPEELFTVYIGIPSDVFDTAFVQSIGNTELQNFLLLALLEQKRTRQFLHFVSTSTSGYAGEIMEQLLQEIIEEKTGYYHVVKGLLARLLSTISMTYNFLLTSLDKQKASDLLFIEVEKFIKKNMSTVTVQELVNEFHYNENYYTRLLKKYSGCTFTEYVKEIRLNEAERLLATTSLSVGEISDEIGYSNHGNFYQHFKKKYGMTPDSYRKIYGKAKEN